MSKRLRQFFSELGEAQQPARIFQDNSRAMEWANGGAARFFLRWNYIDNRYKFIAEMLQEKSVIIEKVATVSVKSDLLTKPFPPKPFKMQLKRLNSSPFPE